MKLKIICLLFSAAGVYATVNSMGCKTASEKEMESTPGETKSHYFGQNCLSCHSEGKESKIVFSVAGSMLDEERKKPNINARVEIYTGPRSTGKKVLTVHTDASGNFYSTKKLDFTNALYPTIHGTKGVKEPVKYMKMPLTIFNKGDCNACHNFVEEKLGID